MARGRRALRRAGGILLTILPVAAAFLAIGGIIFYHHQPAGAATDYSTPITYATVYESSEYAALPRAGGGWTLFYIDAGDRIDLREVAAGGATLLVQTVARGVDFTSTPAMARNAGRTLGAWAQERNGATTLMLAYLGSHRSRPFALNHSGLVEHPDIVPTPGGGFDVLFEWQHPGNFDIFLASIPRGATHPAFIRRLVRSPAYGFYPRGAVDGSGHLDILYLELCCQQRNWLLDFQRFDQSGRHLGRAVTLSSIAGLNGALPEQWGIATAAGAGGSVWGAWLSDQGVALARWGPTGRMQIKPHLIWSGLPDFTTPTLALAAGPRGGTAYYTYPGQLGTLLGAVRFDAAGRAGGAELVASDSGGSVSQPRAGMLNGRPQVIWQKQENPATIVMDGSVYRPEGPSVAHRLGLDNGNVWANILFVAVAALAAGALLAAANVPTLALLVLAWVPVSRLVPERARPAAYLTLVTLILAAIFALPPSPPAWVFAIPPLGRTDSLLAVAGGIAVSAWMGRRLLGDAEGVFRAAGMAFIALYFIASMGAALIVQGVLGQV